MKLFKTTHLGPFLFAFCLLSAQCSKDPGNSTRNIPEERIKFEAENATLSGTLKIDSTLKGYSGKGYVDSFKNLSDELTFQVMNDSFGVYKIYLAYSTLTPGPATCKISINHGTPVQYQLENTGNTFKEVKLTSANLLLNKNIITLTQVSGAFAADYLRIATNTTGPVAGNPVTPGSSPEAIALYNYLKGIYGKHILSGATGITSGLDEENWIYQQTGKYPAIAGFDFMNHTRNYSWENKNALVTNAKLWWANNGIVVAHWHWRDPSHLTDAFYSMATTYNERTSFDASKISDTLSVEYKAMIQDMDTVANYLKQLRDAHVPVIWRPLHEASGRWFWWGYDGSTVTKKIWQVMFNRFVNYHKLNNLIWVWTTDTKQDDLDWYPGDQMVDILGMDIYPTNGDHSSQVTNFKTVQRDFEGTKMITLSECGSIPDPDNLVADQAGWLWFMPWYGNYTRDPSINPVSLWQKMMGHDYVITRDEVPDLKQQ